MNARALARAGRLALSALTASAALRAAPVETVGDLLGAMGNGPNDWAFLVPVAGHVDGPNGEEFRSDLTIWAPDGLPHTVAVGFIARDSDNRTAPLTRLVVGPGPAHVPDFVFTTLGRTGLGAIAVAAVDASGEIDGTVRILGASRVTSRRDCGADASIPVPAVRVSNAGGDASTFPIGPDVRATLGIVNVDSEARPWNVYLGAAPVAIEVPAFSMVQIPVEIADGLDYVSAVSDGNVTHGAAYLAVIRNDTGSGAVLPLAYK